MRLAFWLAGSDASGCCRFAGGPYLAPEYLGTGLAIATSVDNPQLAAAFDYALQQIAVKGRFAELYLRYFPGQFLLSRRATRLKGRTSDHQRPAGRSSRYSFRPILMPSWPSAGARV